MAKRTPPVTVGLFGIILVSKDCWTRMPILKNKKSTKLTPACTCLIIKSYLRRSMRRQMITPKEYADRRHRNFEASRRHVAAYQMANFDESMGVNDRVALSAATKSCVTVLTSLHAWWCDVDRSRQPTLMRVSRLVRYYYWTWCLLKGNTVIGETVTLVPTWITECGTGWPRHGNLVLLEDSDMASGRILDPQSFTAESHIDLKFIWGTLLKLRRRRLVKAPKWVIWLMW